jgi:hypothetical protein
MAALVKEIHLLVVAVVAEAQVLLVETHLQT